MKTTLQAHDFVNTMATETNGFSRKGALALFEYLEDYEQPTDTELDFDPVALRCEFTEYKDLEELHGAYDLGIDIEDKEEYPEDGDWHDDYLAELESNTTVIEFKGGYIIADF